MFGTEGDGGREVPFSSPYISLHPSIETSFRATKAKWDTTAGFESRTSLGLSLQARCRKGNHVNWGVLVLGQYIKDETLLDLQYQDLISCEQNYHSSTFPLATVHTCFRVTGCLVGGP